jgi:hypothetical protein
MATTSREERAVLAAWERVQRQERKGSEKRRREDLKSQRKAQVPRARRGQFPARPPIY